MGGIYPSTFINGIWMILKMANLVYGKFTKINPEQSTWMHNGNPVYYFSITAGANDTVLYALHPVRTHQDIAYCKGWATEYVGEHATVFVGSTFVKKEICLKIIKRGLTELGVIEND